MLQATAHPQVVITGKTGDGGLEQAQEVLGAFLKDWFKDGREDGLLPTFSLWITTRGPGVGLSLNGLR